MGSDDGKDDEDSYGESGEGEDDSYADDAESDAESPQKPAAASPTKPSAGAPNTLAPPRELSEEELNELDELQLQNEQLAQRLKQAEARAGGAEERAAKAEVEMESKVGELKAQLKAAQQNDVIAKDRDKLRSKLRAVTEEHRLALRQAAAGASGYEETKRLVEAQAQLLSTKQALDSLRQQHADLSNDCDAARAFLLKELLDDLGEAASAARQAHRDGDHEAQVEKNVGELLGKLGDTPYTPSVDPNKQAANKGGEQLEETAIARKARRAIDCGAGQGATPGAKGQKGKKASVDPGKYQFVKIAELVRLRVDKLERECQRVVAQALAEAKSAGSSGGGGSALMGATSKLIPTAANTGTGLMSATQARLTGGGGGAQGETALATDSVDAAAMVMSLERDLDGVRQKNRRLEQRCGGLEQELKNAMGHADDLLVLRSKALQLLERQRAEKELRLDAEAGTKLANRKVLALSQHVEKLMLHLKHEAAAKAKANEACGRAQQEVSLLRARNGALMKRAAARDRIIVELKEGAKILEDQLRLMDEKYMELRTKLDYTRQSTGKDVAKYKAQASTLRAKWAVLSASMPGSTGMTLLDEVPSPGDPRDDPRDPHGGPPPLAGSQSVENKSHVSFGPESEGKKKKRGNGSKSKTMPAL